MNWINQTLDNINFELSMIENPIPEPLDVKEWKQLYDSGIAVEGRFKSNSKRATGYWNKCSNEHAFSYEYGVVEYRLKED